MNEITILAGGQGCGKTVRAIELTENKKRFWITGSELIRPFPFQHMPPDVEYIIVDEVQYISIAQKFMSKKLTINRQGKEPISIDMPKIIICLLTEH